eukprot:2453173-Rhodomonas_salina.4
MGGRGVVCLCYAMVSGTGEGYAARVYAATRRRRRPSRRQKRARKSLRQSALAAKAKKKKKKKSYANNIDREICGEISKSESESQREAERLKLKQEQRALERAIQGGFLYGTSGCTPLLRHLRYRCSVLPMTLLRGTSAVTEKEGVYLYQEVKHTLEEEEQSHSQTRARCEIKGFSRLCRTLCTGIAFDLTVPYVLRACYAVSGTALGEMLRSMQRVLRILWNEEERVELAQAKDNVEALVKSAKERHTGGRVVKPTRVECATRGPVLTQEIFCYQNAVPVLTRDILLPEMCRNVVRRMLHVQSHGNAGLVQTARALCFPPTPAVSRSDLSPTAGNVQLASAFDRFAEAVANKVPVLLSYACPTPSPVGPMPRYSTGLRVCRYGVSGTDLRGPAVLGREEGDVQARSAPYDAPVPSYARPTPCPLPCYAVSCTTAGTLLHYVPYRLRYSPTQVVRLVRY